MRFESYLGLEAQSKFVRKPLYQPVQMLCTLKSASNQDSGTQYFAIHDGSSSNQNVEQSK